MKRLENNVTIITGAGKGIGYGLAEAFAEAGSDIVITGRTESRLLEAKERLEAQYGIRYCLSWQTEQMKMLSETS